MPINIYSQDPADTDTIAWLCDDEWDLPGQVYELERWLKINQQTLFKGKYVADIGFQIRKDATGGGGVISTEMIRILNDLGMEIYLSEYGYAVMGLE
jgi:hypothetical protein